ncbi:MAG: hypothetical protein AB1762_10225 [Gemmatimonadota bacterium]
MSAFFKPDGYNSASPYLIVDGAAETIDFLTRVFGARETLRLPDSSSSVMLAEVRVDDE